MKIYKHMEGKVKIEGFNEAPPIAKLVELGKTYYDSGEIISELYLNWQYNDNPFGKPFFSLAIDNEKIVGQYIVIPIQYRHKGNIITGTLSLNTLTHPEYQGMGLFTKMAENTYEICRKHKVSFTVGFPNPLSFGGFIKKLNFKELGYCDLNIKILRPLHFVFNQLKKRKEKHGGDFSIDLFLQSPSNSQVSLLLPTDRELYDELWEGISSNSQYFSVNKTWEFILWRYFDIPNRKYYAVKIMNENKITSLCIFRVEKVLGTNTAVVMDFLIKDGHENDARKLLKLLKNDLRKNKVNLVVIISPVQRKIQKILSKEFFFKVPRRFLPQPIPYIFLDHNFDSIMDGVDNFSNWEVCFGDYDIF
jgi:hypothetical protein